LDIFKVYKINKLIDALNEKDRLLEKQEDLLYEEHDKVVEVEKSLALEIKKNEMLAFELSSCHSSNTSLKSFNTDLNARIEKLSVVSSSMENVLTCVKCKGNDFDACSNHASTIAKSNDEIVQLNVQLKTCKNEVEEVKFAKDAFTIGIHPSIKDGFGFQKGTKNTKSQKALNFTRRRGRHLWLVAHTLFMKRRIMLVCILILRMFLIKLFLIMLIMILVMIVLLFPSVMLVSLLLTLCLYHLVILRKVELGAMHLMLSLMHLRI
jgi:hypothetical protein